MSNTDYDLSDDLFKFFIYFYYYFHRFSFRFTSIQFNSIIIIILSISKTVNLIISVPCASCPLHKIEYNNFFIINDTQQILSWTLYFTNDYQFHAIFEKIVIKMKRRETNSRHLHIIYSYFIPVLSSRHSLMCLLCWEVKWVVV